MRSTQRWPEPDNYGPTISHCLPELGDSNHWQLLIIINVQIFLVNKKTIRTDTLKI